MGAGMVIVVSGLFACGGPPDTGSTSDDAASSADVTALAARVEALEALVTTQAAQIEAQAQQLGMLEDGDAGLEAVRVGCLTSLPLEQP